MKTHFTSLDGFLITAITLYSTGHWIGGTVALIFVAIIGAYS